MTVLLDVESHRIVVYSEVLQAVFYYEIWKQETIGDDDVKKFNCVDNNCRMYFERYTPERKKEEIEINCTLPMRYDWPNII